MQTISIRLAAVAVAAVAACGGGPTPAPVTPAVAPIAAAAPAAPAASIDPATAAAIEATALDYIDGWYAGDADRMARALHPELAKRIVQTKDGKSVLEHMGADRLVEGTRKGYGKDTPADKRLHGVTILDVFENAASVRVDASDWVDYLHVAKFDGRWVIVNVLWEMKPGAK